MPKKENKKLTLDLTAQPTKEEHQVTVSELFKHGTKEEKLRELQVIAALLRVGMLEPFRANLLADVLQEIAEGVKPHIAFGLNTKNRISARDIKHKQMLVDILISQGKSEIEACELIETLNWQVKAMSNEELTNWLIKLGAAKQKAIDFVQKYPSNLLFPLKDKNKFRGFVEKLDLSEGGVKEVVSYYYQSFQTGLESTGKLKKSIQRKRKS